ncbi:MAG TPA: Gfo/Idh/MocA family oxidoreductase [Gemmataceae bacterium]|nr:Gfo/Idh/MocA family oxidoreductase [Gemmataceae bacterium]
MTRLRMAVIGVGHLGQHHARILAGFPDVELAGVADANPEQARTIAERLGTAAYDHFEPLLGRVDAVSVVTPTIFHHHVASAFLRHRIPVMVEKPVCRTVAEANDLIELAQRAGVPLQVGHIERFNPAFEELARRPIRPKFVEAERHGPFTGRSIDIGAVLDLMIHDLDLLLALVGGPVRGVAAVGAAVFGGHEDMVNARLEFANGCIAHVTASRITQRPKRRLRIWAPEGYAGIDFVSRKLTLVQPGEEVRRFGLRVDRLDAAAKARLKDEVFGRYLQALTLDGDRKGDQLTAELRHFVDCVRSGRRPRVTGEDGRDALELAERVLAAVRSHQWEGSPDGPTGPGEMPKPAGWLFQPVQRSEAA